MEGTDEIKILDNLEIHKDHLVVSVNPKFYSRDVVYSAIYVFLDSCYCKVDGDPSEEIIVTLKPKQKTGLEMLGSKFNNELINYASVAIRGAKTVDIRAEIVKKALESHQGKAE